MIKCIIFDLGGVIIEFTNDEHYYSYLAKVSRVSVKKVKKFIEGKMWILLDKDLILQKDFDRKVARKLKIRENQVKWYETYEKEGRIDSGTMSIVKRLRKNYSVAYLSNVDRSRYTWTLKLLKPYQKMFACRVASFEIRERKPGAAIYKYTLERMKLEPSEVIFVDNMRENVVGARKVGIKSILFTSANDLEKKLKKMGVRF